MWIAMSFIVYILRLFFVFYRFFFCIFFKNAETLMNKAFQHIHKIFFYTYSSYQYNF
jgi:hypothetical protein